MVRFVNDHNVSETCGALKRLTLRLRIDICVRHQLQVAECVLTANVR
jgi:hypothetical protein